MDRRIKVGIAGQIFILVALQVGLFVGLAHRAWVTIETVRIKGPLYDSIIEGKDLIADVLPPPEYIIESYLVVLQLTQETNPDRIAELVARGSQLRVEYETTHLRWDRDLPPGPLRTAMVDESYRAAIAFYEARDDAFLAAVRTGDHAAATALARGELYQHYAAHRRAIDRVVVLATERNRMHEATATNELRAGMSTLLGLGMAGLVLALALGMYARGVARRLVRRVSAATAAAERVAAGDLTVRVAAEGSDEAGALLVSIRAMAESLESLVTRVKRSSVELMSTATEFAATTASQEATAAGFGASSSQIAAAVKEISATSQELLSAMEDVSRTAGETADIAEDGRASIVNLDQRMRGLASSSTGISSKLATIRDKAGDINLVVTTITKIADQTHLLSVNAAIEAEKAGEHGLGFLVLAREIRRLADQTAVSTLNIEQIVRQMQSAVSTGVTEMERFANDVEKGVAIANDVGLRFGGIIEQVKSASDRFEQVGEGMRSQNQGARQIDEAMRSLTDGARHTAASVREFNAATEHLRDAVGGLRNEIARFRVSE